VFESTKNLGNLLDGLEVLGSLEGLLSVSVSGSHLHLAVLGGELAVVVEEAEEVLSEGLEVVAVLLSNISEGNARGVLQTDASAESSLALHDAEWSFGGSAELRKPADELDRIAVGSDDDELGRSVFN
jgi:hypothetical protein